MMENMLQQWLDYSCVDADLEEKEADGEESDFICSK